MIGSEVVEVSESDSDEYKVGIISMQFSESVVDDPIFFILLSS